ncbi:hypothetical protein ES702_03077 [subsurface metagenome]
MWSYLKYEFRGSWHNLKDELKSRNVKGKFLLILGIAIGILYFIYFFYYMLFCPE